ncbi:MAG: type II CRISPR-associated endonuclease Cas1 [Phycisphaeraceae bacterium]|nr:type II CRISPR-associated endonuclease Cas1 [Phycisphaeraceae bacterium]
MPAAERILDFSDAQAHLSLRYEQLVISVDDRGEMTMPLAEIAAIILASPRVTATQPALAGVMRHGGSIIVCDDARQPAGMMLPLSGNSTQTRRMIAQVRASLPTCKRLWKQIVQAKIRSQAAALRAVDRNDGGLPALVSKVRSGDSTNVESWAAQRYWPLLFEDPTFRRRRDASSGGDQNRLLNYGYAVLRAAVGRAICAAGLHPSVGVHHRGRSNPWCLSDDLMEPYRPLIDRAVVELVTEYGNDCPLDGQSKPRLVSVLTDRLTSDGDRRTVFDWITRTASSLARVFLGDEARLYFPDGLYHASDTS